MEIHRREGTVFTRTRRYDKRRVRDIRREYTRQGEAIAIIVRFIGDQWAITQRLIGIDVCSKTVNANELARVLDEALCVEFGARANSLLAAMGDGARVNFLSKDVEYCVFFPHAR